MFLSGVFAVRKKKVLHSFLGCAEDVSKKGWWMGAAMKEGRKEETMFGTPPPRDLQSNGVAERAVGEFTGQLRRIKLGLEARRKETIPNEHVLVGWLNTQGFS